MVWVLPITATVAPDATSAHHRRVGNVAVLRAGVVQDGHYEVPSGGDLVHLFSIGNHASQPHVPTSANNLARRVATPLYGAGMIEAIPDRSFVFGKTLQIKMATASARAAAMVMDPESHLRGFDQFTNFMRFLAPVIPLPRAGSMHRGSEIFSSIRCAACPVPTLLTGPSDVPALGHKQVNAYSDFLLHDIGTGDGVELWSAKGNEFRTSPLWGLRFRKQLTHDGSALSPAEAIRQHHNEGERSRQGFERMASSEKQALLDSCRASRSLCKLSRTCVVVQAGCRHSEGSRCIFRLSATLVSCSASRYPAEIPSS